MSGSPTRPASASSPANAPPKFCSGRSATPRLKSCARPISPPARRSPNCSARRGRASLFPGNAELTNRLRPRGEFLGEPRRESVVAERAVHTVVGEALLDRWHGDNGEQRLFKLVANRQRRAGRQKDAVPVFHHHARQAKLLGGWQIRQQRGAFGGENGPRFDRC